MPLRNRHIAGEVDLFQDNTYQCRHIISKHFIDSPQYMAEQKLTFLLHIFSKRMFSMDVQTYVNYVRLKEKTAWLLQSHPVCAVN